MRHFSVTVALHNPRLITTIGAGAGILCGGRSRLQVQCADIRMLWCNGLIANAVTNEIETIDNEDNTSDMDLEAIDSDEVEVGIDYDYEAELTEMTIENCHRLGKELTRAVVIKMDTHHGCTFHIVTSS